jgi:hypothetical protein
VLVICLPEVLQDNANHLVSDLGLATSSTLDTFAFRLSPVHLALARPFRFSGNANHHLPNTYDRQTDVFQVGSLPCACTVNTAHKIDRRRVFAGQPSLFVFSSIPTRQL